MLIVYSSHFLRAYKKCPKDIQTRAKEQEKIFRINHFDPRLKTHKLAGNFFGYYAFSITYNYRIIFRLDNRDAEAYFITIGDHSIY